MRTFLAILFLTISLSSFPEELMENEDVDLAHILGTQEVLYESKSFPFVQVIQTWESISECSGAYESCPNARLFILVSTGDLYEAPRLYELPKSKGWEIADSGESEHEKHFIVKTAMQHANVSSESRATWVSKTYKVSVSKYSAVAKLVK